MTEKRFKSFTSSIDYHIVEDTLENRYLSKEDVITVLNEFWVQYEYYEKENKQLKQEIKDLRINVLDSLHEADEIQCTCSPCVVEECVKRVVE